MALEIKITPEELRELGLRLGTLALQMEAVSNKTKGAMQTMATSVSPDFVRNLDWKGRMLVSQLDILVGGLKSGAVKATYAADWFQNADMSIGKESTALLDSLANIDELRNRGENLFINVGKNALDEVFDEETGVGLAYGLIVDTLQGELSMDSYFSLLDWAAGKSHSMRLVTETVEAAFDHTMDYAEFNEGYVTDLQNGDYISSMVKLRGSVTSQVLITGADATGSMILGIADSAPTLIPGVTVGDATEFLFGQDLSGMWDNCMVGAREFSQDVIERAGEVAQDCFDYGVNVVKDTMNNIEDGFNDICNAIGGLFSW